jgi:hypothetical protein
MSDNICSCVCYQDFYVQLEEAQDKIDELRAREARLREALTMFTMFYPFGISLELDQAFRTARAALGEEKK